MKILILNCGSSSLKFQLLAMPSETLLASGGVERIGDTKSILKFKTAQGAECSDKETGIANHEIAIESIINLLLNPTYALLKNKEEIAAVGHRVVHGAEEFSSSIILTEANIAHIEKYSNLAPLHNPANISGVRAAQAQLPHAVQCATFDTAFHQTMSPKAFMYALPYEYYTNNKVRRYGFHGSSHRYVSQKAAELAHLPYESSKIIVCHLGNGSSISAVNGGTSVDTSMGLTPVEGLPMGTRCGDVDFGAMLYIMRNYNLSTDEIDAVANKKSGFLGICGTSDMRDMKEAAKNGNTQAQLAMDIFHYKIKKYIGSYAAAMGGVDCIAFTGGIGENNPLTRAQSCEGLEFMGVEFDHETNNAAQGDARISRETSRVQVWVVQTNEEIVIARDTYELVEKQ
ncbi:MAG: acetate kinase [Bacteroidales bacterium]|jgi:acetate kinase|nr:acetate kinase [Bacteroidales bacterium]